MLLIIPIPPTSQDMASTVVLVHLMVTMPISMVAFIRRRPLLITVLLVVIFDRLVHRNIVDREPAPPPPPPMRTFTRQVYPPIYGGARMVRSSRAGMSSFDQQQQQQRYYRSFSGPVKNPAPIYRKRREPPSRFQETEFVGPPPIDPTFAYAPTLSRRYYYGGGGYSIDQQQQQQPTLLRRTRPYYAPSYTTATRQRRRRRDLNDEDAQRYPTWARIVAAAILGLVLGPMRGQSFHDFVILTRTEWQGAVVGLVASFAILTLMLVVSGIFLAVSQPVWRQIDAVISSGAVFSYLFVACLESYYAACYPPLGADIRVVCYRAEWIIAAILCFINLVLYIIDLVLAFRTGVSVL